jgi:hypothetical protein
MTTVTRLQNLFNVEKVDGDSSSSLCCDHCRGKLRSPVHRYWRMRFCSAACMNAYQQRLSPDTQQNRGKRPERAFAGSVAELSTVEKFRATQPQEQSYA